MVVDVDKGKEKINEIDVCMPTWRSGEVLGKTLDSLKSSIDYAGVRLGRLILVDNVSEDKTVDIAASKSDEYGWALEIIRKEASLPMAREVAIREVKSTWFLFLDDDVRICEEYISNLVGCVAPGIGAVQGRKKTSGGEPWEWTQRRIYRGGTHATLIRKEAVSGICIPDGIKVLEDEFIRRHIESNEYIWVFNHQAMFQHDSMDRHPMGWEQGVIAGRYGLMPLHSVLLFLGDAIVSFKPIFGRIMLLAGWLYGRLRDR